MRYIVLILFVLACGVVGYPVAKIHTHYAMLAAWVSVFAGCALFLPKTFTYMPKLGVTVSMSVALFLSPLIVALWLAIGPVLYRY